MRETRKVCCQQISGWHSNQKLRGKVLQAYQILAIEEEWRRTAAAETDCKLQRTSNCNIERSYAPERALGNAREDLRLGRFSPNIAELPPCTSRGDLRRIKTLVNV